MVSGWNKLCEDEGLGSWFGSSDLVRNLRVDFQVKSFLQDMSGSTAGSPSSLCSRIGVLLMANALHEVLWSLSESKNH